jgi:hypothetical protein
MSLTYGAKAQTWAEAERLKIPPIEHYSKWYDFARLVNGYALAEEVAIDLKKWGRQQHLHWRETGKWHLPISALLMMLFYFWRRQHMTGGITFVMRLTASFTRLHG